MSKRYTDTEKWKKQWFRELSTTEKSTWFYITEQCDNVGVWDADFAAAEFMIGEKIDWQGFIKKVNNNIEILNNGKWWLNDFCSFQYTDLSPTSKSIPVISHIKLLKKHGLYERVMEKLKVTASLDRTLKTKEKVKENVKVKEKAVINIFNKITGKKITKAQECIKARLNEGFTVEDTGKVIQFKYLQWKDDIKMRRYIRISTLFRPSHFEEYLAEANADLPNILNEKYEKYKNDCVKEYQDTGNKVKILTLKDWKYAKGYAP